MTLPDWLWRAALRAGFAVLRVWWWLTRPHHDSALVALWHDERVYLVQASYRALLSLPGGGADPGEAPLDTALRELREECALRLDPAVLRLALQLEGPFEHRIDHVSIFEAVLAVPPALTVDRREILWARPFALDAALAQPLAPHVRRYLEALPAPPAGDRAAIAPPPQP